MIYLIGGIAKAGKTYVAKRLMAKIGCGYFSTDYLMMALFRAMPEGPVDPEDADDVVSKAMEPFLRGMLRAMVENGLDYILEGVHLTPASVSRWMREYPGKLRCVFLGYKDWTVENKWKELKIHAQALENDWLAAYPPEKQIQTIRYLIIDSELLAKTAEDLGFPYIEVHDILRQADDIIRLLTL